jgi:hypothetical protein
MFAGEDGSQHLVPLLRAIHTVRRARIFMEFGVCRWMVGCVQIVLFGVACGVGADAVS